MIALAQRLDREGHDVVIAGPPDYAAAAERRRLHYHPYGFAIDKFLAGTAADYAGGAWRAHRAVNHWIEKSIDEEFAALPTLARGFDLIANVSEFIAVKFDTFGYRISLLNEVRRLRSKGRYFPANVSKFILASPNRYDDFIQFIGFIDNNCTVNLIDIGANHGDFTKDFHLFFPKNDFIYCFEPNPTLRENLEKSLSQTPNVKLFFIALGDKKDALELKVPEGADGLGSFLTYNDDSNAYYNTKNPKLYSVNTDTLDNIVGELRGTVIVKIDAQGFESKVIEGAQKTLLKCYAVLLECSFAPMHEEHREASFIPCNAKLSELGFVPVVFQRFGTKVNTYAFERDVLYVKRELSNKVYHNNT